MSSNWHNVNSNMGFDDNQSNSTTFTPSVLDYTCYLTNSISNAHGCHVDVPAQVINLYQENDGYNHPENLLSYSNHSGVEINTPCGGVPGPASLNYNCFDIVNSPYDFKENQSLSRVDAAALGFNVGTPYPNWPRCITHNIVPNDMLWSLHDVGCGYKTSGGSAVLQLYFDFPWNHHLYLDAELNFTEVEGVAPLVHVAGSGGGVDLPALWATENGFLGDFSIVRGMVIRSGHPGDFNMQGIPESIGNTRIYNLQSLEFQAADEILLIPGPGNDEYFEANAGCEFQASISPCLYPVPARISNSLSVISEIYPNSIVHDLKYSEEILTAYPNPSTNFVNVEFNLEKEHQITLELINQYGEKVASVLNGNYKNGKIYISADVLNLKNAIYYILLKTQSGTFTKKIAIVN